MKTQRKSRPPSRAQPGRHAVGDAAERRVGGRDDAAIDWWDELRVGDDGAARDQRKRGVAIDMRSKRLRKGRALESKRGQQ